MKTYLMIWHSSEGGSPTEVHDRLVSMGFKPVKGTYDYVYEWNRMSSIHQILEIGNAVHATLKGQKVLFKLETVNTD
ncbi:MAG: hypothetical protein ACXACA_01230 [Candidatus Ranarchaeia archaeon]